MVYLVVTGLTAAAAAPTDCSNIRYNGSGTSAEPYMVGNLNQLQCIEENLSGHYSLSNNIDASETENWKNGFQPLGKFSGELDGNSHEISNLYIDGRGEGYIGLFSMIGAEGVVENVSITKVDIRNGDWYVGSVAGLNNGTVKYTFTDGSITGEGASGGITGSNSGLINFTSFSGQIKGRNQIGGLVGVNQKEGTVAVSYTEGSVDAEKSGGGLIGYNKGTVLSSYSISEVSSTSWNYTGSFIGMNPGTVSSGYWLEDGNPESYWYKQPVEDYGKFNGSSLEKSMMTGDACGMKGFNFSRNWDMEENSFPNLQISENDSNDSRDCSNYVKESESSSKLPGTALMILGFLAFALFQYKAIVYVDRKFFD